MHIKPRKQNSKAIFDMNSEGNHAVGTDLFVKMF